MTIYDGFIYWSDDPTSPAELYGGTWQRLKDVFLLCAGDLFEAGSSGGEAQHTLTINEMPSHTHYILGRDTNTQQGSQAVHPHSWDGIGGDVETGPTGNSKPHNNMPPYQAAYAWKKIG